MDKQAFLSRYLVDRRGTDSYKWDAMLEEKFGSRDLISMWIADMEFKTPEAVVDALVRRAQDGVFGYSSVPEKCYTAYSDWMERRYGFALQKEWLRFTTGCVTAIAWMIQAFTKPEDHCLILTPVYYPFHNVVTYNDRRLVTVDLRYEEGCFSLDYEAIENAIVDSGVKMLIQCSPHNPAGRVWTEGELDRLFSICRRHGVLVVSDEIHQDLVLVDRPFVPAAMVRNGAYRDMVVTLSSASKTFNLATLIHAHIIITDEKLRETYDHWARGMNRTENNVLGLEAAWAGYTYGEDWLSGLLAVIRDNYEYMKQELHARAPDVIVCPLEGTYLAMLDLRRCMDAGKVKDFILKDCRLAVDYGEQFGANFEGFVRLNLATDPELVHKAVYRIITELEKRNAQA